MIPASPESYDFQPRHYFPRKLRNFCVYYSILHYTNFEPPENSQCVVKARGGSDARVGELMIIAKQVATSNPFCCSSILRFFAKKVVFSILWAGPLKNDDFSSIAEKGTYWPIQGSRKRVKIDLFWMIDFWGFGLFEEEEVFNIFFDSLSVVKM